MNKKNKLPGCELTKQNRTETRSRTLIWSSNNLLIKDQLRSQENLILITTTI